MEDATFIYLFFPAGVQRIIATGSTSYVGIIDQDTVLKYPHEQHDQRGLKVEAAILGVLGSHPRIIKLKGWDKEGLRLEYARQAAEAVAYAHTKDVLHCDIRLGNLLLDKSFDIKLCDFQGIYRTVRGVRIVERGYSSQTFF
ncbi:hypothetical protein BU26DRAFT_440754 [Trematosphaeria pertusa]|uniref:EKC/KEOPS complex subunit BUD32 n=1 Tax=Trematosphaeria pertusa TaxID=390896 RepID=A0A6A6HUB4_9PLEO|nr:uncharacterized protein BU26DRAFT_440754 [Trematosphaeria pertusa]KAF2241372.1 hypothetical protein BU26DRAFT_440754 [Trematosphaeria pertusa]